MSFMATTCSATQCARPVLARGLCSSHYAAARRAGLPVLDRRIPARCSSQDCDRDAYARGLCRNHYGAERRRKFRQIPETLYPQVVSVGWDVQPNGCWDYRGLLNDRGYGRIETVPVHRIVFAYHNGGLDPNLVVRHTCDNRPCVNPDHLLVGSQADNMRDMLDRGRQYQQKKTHCPAGHPLVEGNLVKSSSLNGHRNCQTCNRQATRIGNALIRDAAKALGVTQPTYITEHGYSAYAAAAVLADLALAGAL